MEIITSLKLTWYKSTVSVYLFIFYLAHNLFHMLLRTIWKYENTHDARWRMTILSYFVHDCCLECDAFNSTQHTATINGKSD